MSVTQRDQSGRVRTPTPPSRPGYSSLLAGALLIACSKAAPRGDAPVQQAAAASLASADCVRESLHPSAVPPAEGIWMNESSSNGQRVSVMIGPAEVRAGATVLTRTIETVEEASGAPPLRARLDDAVVRVELVPHLGGKPVRSWRQSGAGDGLEPAAVYTLTTLVLVASYESCPGLGPAAIRYLRRDEHGRVVSDAILRRLSSAQ